MFRDFNSKVGGGKRIQPHATKRCVICNSVNSYEVAVGDGDIDMHSYYEVEYGESKVPAYLCAECYSSEYEIRSEWNMSDEE